MRNGFRRLSRSQRIGPDSQVEGCVRHARSSPLVPESEWAPCFITLIRHKETRMDTYGTYQNGFGQAVTTYAFQDAFGNTIDARSGQQVFRI